MIKILRSTILPFLFVSMAYASVPAELKIQNQPINALCFFNMEGTSNTIDLSECDHSKYKYVIKDRNATLIKKGFIGYDWQNPTLNDTQGYSYYKIFNADNHQFWIYSVNSGGGSGEFTAVQLIKRKDINTLETKSIAGGDRCNGGIQHVSEQDHQLTFSVNLTAYDLVHLARNYDTSVKAYDNLAACAVCCVASAFYSVNAGAKSQLQYIELNNIKNAQGMPTQGKQQACFNSLFASYITTGKSKLERSQLDKFVNKFNQRCLKIK